ncbi:MAG: hypothetical protein NC131_07535 [Roseburia sp.]|nr:hypothetical protein [Roseburia sp.]
MIKQKQGGYESILELYDGQMATLSNKRLLSSAVPELAFSAHGKELFALSESYYCKWLEGGGDLSLVDRAIELCRESASLGYPHAVLKMAFYYDKDYLAPDRTEEFRCRVASDYYAKIVYAEETPKFYDAVTPEMPWEDIQRCAAQMFLEMLAGAQQLLAGYAEGKYSYAENAARIREKFGIVPERGNLSQRFSYDGEKFAETVLVSCKRNKTRAPLFGILSLKRAECLKVFAQKSAVMRICGDINIWLDCGDRVFRVNNTSAFFNYLEGLSADEIWVYFVNNNSGGHRYLSGKQRKDLCELMMRDGFSRFIRLKESAAERGRQRYVFSDDDIQFFINGRLTGVKSALDSLIDRVVCDNEWGNL